MIKLYNTLSGQKEEFKPLTEGEVLVYACGITVSGAAHIGHARQAVLYDVFRRYFESLGYVVKYVRNFTDVDDKIIAKAHELGTTAFEVSARFIDETLADLDKLKVQRATHEPKVSDHIPDIISFIEELIAKGYGYVSQGDVLFDVSQKSDYGKLSARRLEDCLNADSNPNKKNPQDFALWKSAKPGEPYWDSPWGPGRPGWHIECSAMARKYLGDSFDIHGGGVDLVFPHHENEIAQSESLTGKPLANFWIHNGLINVDGKKMSKSLGNIYPIAKALEEHHRDVIRFAILSYRYDSPIDFTTELFRNVTKRVYWFYRSLNRVDQLISESSNELLVATPAGEEFSAEMLGEFQESMNDDFNTAKVMALLGQRITKINELLDSKKISLAEKIGYLMPFRRAFTQISRTLGTFDEDPMLVVNWFKQRFLRGADIQEQDVEQMIEDRRTAKKTGDYALADQIRETLKTQGITISDSPDGTKWDLLV